MHQLETCLGSPLTSSLAAVISAEWLSVLIDFYLLSAPKQQLNGE